MEIPHIKIHHSVWTSSFGGVCAMGIMFYALSVGATELAVPWECSAFVGEAQDWCIRTFVELQQEKIPIWKRILKFNSKRFSNSSNKWRNKHRLQRNSNANSHTNLPAGMALLQDMSILPQPSAFVLAETGFLADRCIMEFPGTLVQDFMAMDIVAGTVTNLWGNRMPLVKSNNF